MPFGRSAVAVLARAADPGRASCGDLPPTELQTPSPPLLNYMLSADALPVPPLATERTSRSSDVQSFCNLSLFLLAFFLKLKAGALPDHLRRRSKRVLTIVVIT